MNEVRRTEKGVAHVFGPVPSRRLGRSLGVDLVPFKTCTYNCIYCQLGATTHLTCEVREYVPLREVHRALEVAFQKGVEADYVTLSGSGEPTLHSGIGEVIRMIKSLTAIPVAVLTNGSLLHRSRVREQLLQADLIIPSLDAGSEPLFRLINRPHPSLSLEKLVRGLIRLREEFSGAYWLEVMLLGGISGLDSEVCEIAEIVDEIRPHRIQLNTVRRPPAEPFAYPVSREKLEHFRSFFAGRAEVIEERSWSKGDFPFGTSEKAILSLVQRRPCSLDDLCAGLGAHRSEVGKYLDKLLEQGAIQSKVQGDERYYLYMEGRQTEKSSRRE
ncbi:MAG: radical SAM protein [candidate division NC10 bacterium]|nr:radical SAM protein [candidate division NC10 bacterium]